MTESLIEFWRRCDLSQKPFVHPDDELYLTDRYIHKRPFGFRSYVEDRDFNREGDHRLHVSLIPNPYLGDLNRADIFVLMLNPGFHFSDYAAEENTAFWRRHVQTLHQNFGDEAYPFIFFDPELCWHSGFVWWERKFKSILRKLADNIGYLKAMRTLANRVAAIELLPYHSPSFRAHKLLDVLPSVQAAREFVRGPLLDRAKSGDALIVVTRQARAWGIEKLEGKVVVYDANHARGANLGCGTEGGKRIIRWLNS